MPHARNRRLYYVALTVDSLAYQVQSVAIAWHVFTLRHRPFDLGLVGLALFVPILLFALPAGVVTDRFDRRVVATGAIMVEALAIGAFVFAVVLGVRSLGVYLAVLGIIGTARAFSTPAARTLLVSIVSPQEYLPAQALASSIRQLTIIGGPALGGLLVAWSTPLALTAAAVAMFLSAMLIPALRIVRSSDAAPPRMREALEGLRFITSRPVVAGAISLDLCAVLFGGATALLPAFADGIFHAGPTGLGALRSAPAVGAAVVAAVLVRRPLRRRVGPTLLVTVAGFGLATIAFGLSKSFVLSLVLLAVAGGTDMVSVVIRNGLVQLGTPDAMRGRVNAVENVFIGASNELGEFESGTLANFIGVVPAVVAGGVGTLAIIALWGVAFPALRRADRFSGAG